ncbi:MAG: dihydropyrimidinase [Bacillota bacterium]|nr:dihydropyrimidinase [Bacillota bacterium]
MKLLLKGGTVVSGSDCRKADVLIEDEKITQVGLGLTCPDAVTQNVSGKLLFPGFIDAHTHFDLESGGTVTADDFRTGSQAAILGGTTTVIDFTTQYRGESLKKALSNWHRKADGKASCDYGFHMSIADWNPSVSDEIDEMTENGITSYKLYMTYDALKVDDRELYQILKRLKAAGGIAGVHCENSGLIDALAQEQKALGHTGAGCHPRTRPAAAEAEAVNRLLRIAEVAETPVIIVHLSTKEGLKAVVDARKRGQKVYVETCPQYLLLDDSLYDLPGIEGYKYVIAPPLRKKDDQECLWQALSDNQIQTVSTDHCSFNMSQKLIGKDDFTKIPGGMPGVETRAVLIYTYGVMNKRITLPQMCSLLAENPAKLYGIYPQKGVIAPGADADIVVYDPAASYVIHAADQHQNVDYAPFENYKISGRVEKVFLRGRLAADGGRITAENTGRYVKRGKCSL